MDVIKVNWLNDEQIHAEIDRLENVAGKTVDELREAQRTWDMTVEQRDCLDRIESLIWLVEGESPLDH